MRWRCLISATLLCLVATSAQAASGKKASAPIKAPEPVCPEVPPPAPPPPAPPRPSTVRVMIPDMSVAPRFAEARNALSQVVAEEAARVQGYELLSAADVRAVLDQEATKQVMGCDDNSCLAELAEALDAELVVSSSIGLTPDNVPLLSLSLVNAKAIVVVNRVNVVWRGEESRLPDVVRTSAQRLLLPAKQRKPGAIIITGAPEGATVYVDGTERTRDHNAGRLGGLDVGVHEVVVEAPDKVQRTIAAVVLSGEDATVDGTLDDVPVATGWLIAGGVASVVVGAALTGAVLYVSGRGDVAVSADIPSASVNDVEALRGANK